jgi:GNAT superfamily N-acetyltransferase
LIERSNRPILDRGDSMISTHPPLPVELVPTDDVSFDLEKRKEVTVRGYHIDFTSCPDRPGVGLDKSWSNKPLVMMDKQAMFAEFALLTLFRKTGWEGVWADAHHRKYFDKMPNQSKGASLNTYINQVISRIAENNNNSKAGCWDIILWANRMVAFVKMKNIPSDDEIGDAQLGWLNAALKSGLSAGQFLVVEWDYRKVVVKRKRPTLAGAQSAAVVYSIATDAEIPLMRELFKEYAASIGIDLSFQEFNAELDTLPGKYAQPEGAMILVRRKGEPCGCVALRRINARTCEMKRLYVRAAARGLGIGRALVIRVIEEARARGYASMRLDTLPFMKSAEALYKSLGFREIPPYTFNPIAGTLFLEKALQQSGQ